MSLKDRTSGTARVAGTAVPSGRAERPQKRAEVRTRRRGEELEAALLDAAWAELLDKGLEAMTYEGVAARAATSRAVLYRRWPTKGELALAAIRHARLLTIGETPDTGSLRGDLKAVLMRANETKFLLGLTLITQIGALHAETGKSPEDIRESIVSAGPTRTAEIWERAISRGEADPARLTPRIRRLYFDLFRDRLFMTLNPVPEAEIEEMLDEVVLPLVQPR